MFAFQKLGPGMAMQEFPEIGETYASVMIFVPDVFRKDNTAFLFNWLSCPKFRTVRSVFPQIEPLTFMERVFTGWNSHHPTKM